MAFTDRREVAAGSVRKALAAALFAFFVTSTAAAAVETVSLEAPEELAPLLREHLSVLAQGRGIPADDIDRIALVRRARREASGLLATEGYFSPQVRLERLDGRWVLRVEPGVRSRVSSVQFSLQKGNVLEADEGERVLAELKRLWPLPEGEPFTQARWDSGKGLVIEHLSRRVFAAARLSASRAVVDPAGAGVALALEIDPGPRFRFGPLRIEGLNDYDEALVRRYRPPAQGEPYDEDRLLAFQAALQSTPYFASALVEIDRTPERAGAAPVRVLLGESKPRRVTLGAGFSTNTGYRAELGYRDANLFGRAWQLVSGLRVEQRNLLLFGDVFLPPSGAGYRDSVGALHETSDLEGLRISREALGVTRTYRIPKGEFGVSVRYQQERTSPDGAASSRQAAVTTDFLLVWRDVNDLLDPRRGFVALARLGGAAKAVLSDQNFVRAHARLQTYFPVGARDVLALRGELGKTFSTSRAGIPQDFLFRAGGSQSVRGYGYRSLGLQLGDAVVGGRYLATASAEYTHWRPAGWGVALFVDTGNVVDDPSELRLLTGYGVGGRWKSPAGPLALDLAYGHDDRRFRLHFSIQIAY